MSFDDLERRLRRLPLPPAPEGLERRILAAAALPAGPAGWLDRVWFSRAARVGWAAAILLLLAAEIALGRSGAPARRPQEEPAPAAVGAAEELGLDARWGARLLEARRPAPADERSEAAILEALG